ncbi:MAG TPA: hypothetical protein VIJ25_09735, partial [Methylococcales bacterium]
LASIRESMNILYSNKGSPPHAAYSQWESIRLAIGVPKLAYVNLHLLSEKAIGLYKEIRHTFGAQDS